MSELYVKTCYKNYEGMVVKAPTNKEDLDSMVRGSLGNLVSMLETNNQLISKFDDLTAQPSWYPPAFILFWDHNNRRKFRSTEVVYFSPHPVGNSALNASSVAASQGILGDLVRLQMHALSSLEENRLHPLQFVHEFGPNYLKLCQTGLYDKCEQCGSVIAAGSMTSHTGSMTCMVATLDRDMRDESWYRVDVSGDMAAIRRAGIHFEVRPSHMNMWVPRWVGEAIETYKQNSKEGSGPWAGLKLHEYLVKVHPEK